MYKKISRFAALIVLVAGSFFSCQKTRTNPCEGLLNESPPKYVFVRFIDKQTGDNLIVTNNLDADDIKVTIGQTGELYKNWEISNNYPSSSPLYGLVGFTVFQETAGNYPYKIQVGDLGTVTLSYTIDEVKSDSPCKRYYYPMKDIKITDHPFELLKYGDKNILVVAL
jgi:hypothetical protein